MKLTDRIETLNGIGSKRAEILGAAGIRTVGDVLENFPRTYLDMSKITPIRDTEDGQITAVRGKVVTGVSEKRSGPGGRLTVYSFVVSDNTGEVTVTLFNRKFTAEKIKKDDILLLYGKVTASGFFRSMSSPLIEEPDRAEILPVYRLSEGLSQNIMRKTAKQALAALESSAFESTGIETLPTDICEEFGLIPLKDALEEIHFPKSEELLRKARQRLIIDELLRFMLGMSVLRRKNRAKKAVPLLDSKNSPETFFAALPFEPTNAQKRVIGECLNDMKRPVATARLIQGDVGSGKTAVAAALIYYAVGCGHSEKDDCGYQASLMAPTEVLALQHYKSLSPLMKKLGVKTELLTGSTKPKDKKRILESLRDGTTDLCIGTHALISEGVEFKNLVLAITDEQHRFGVKQRAALSEKGKNPHTVIMSATPIPRTMALILYGDLDVSVIDELPAGRMKISTFTVGSEKHGDMYGFLRSEILKGRQAYVVCPLVEDGDDEAMKSVVSFAEEIASKYLEYLNVAYLHGKMPSKEKEKILKDFSENKIQVLVATTVIEVGINVPNATVMIVENAERFGLSQLHQLRGRVGRGSKKSYCFLVSDNEGSKERLAGFCSTDDGFEISKQDLALRGPGDFFGLKQHGLPEFRIAELSDMEQVELAKKIADKITTQPDWFRQPEYAVMRQNISRMFSDSTVT